MSDRRIIAEPLTREAFAPFGQVIESEGADRFTINRGTTERFHDLARIELEGQSARPLISIFRGTRFVLPFNLDLMERHPLGSQAFMPLSPEPFLVTVAQDDNGQPATPHAFLTTQGQGINIARNVWHGTLSPLSDNAQFLVIDRGGDGDNLEEHVFETPWIIDATGD